MCSGRHTRTGRGHTRAQRNDIMISTRSARLIPFILAGTLTAGDAQQAQPVQQGTVIGLPVPPLGSGPFEFQAAEQQKIRVSVVARGLSHPWSVVFLPDSSMLVT